MDQQSAPPTIQPGSPPLPNTQTPPGNKPKASKLPMNKKSLMFILTLVILILLIPLILLSVSKRTKPAVPPVPTPKTWEVILNYNPSNQNLSVKKLSILNKEINQDFRSAQFSPYELIVSDKTDRALFRTKINITEQLIYNLIYNPSSSESAELTQPQDLETMLYIPYQPTAAKILINKDYSPLLQINVTPQTSFNLVPEVFAQTPPESCGGLQVVFISEGYNNPVEFHQDVEQIKNIFNSTEPFASTRPSIFDFQELYNTTSFGCVNGIAPNPQTRSATGCIQNPQIQQLGRSRYPRASKFIVLVNNPNAASVDRGILGVTNDIGGDLSVFTNRQEMGRKFPVAAHEFLGHAVGQLYDRYVLNIPDYGKKAIDKGIRSNCTDNRTGESFWRTAGSQGVYPGCSNQSYYSPGPLSCPGRPGDQFMLNGGISTSMMSAYGCGGDSFDSVETAWIRQRVIPLYQNACPTPTTAPQPTTSQPTTAPQPTTPQSNSQPRPTISQADIDFVKSISPPIYGVVYIDENRNGRLDGNEGSKAIFYSDYSVQNPDGTIDNRLHQIGKEIHAGDQPSGNLLGSYIITFTPPAGYEITGLDDTEDYSSGRYLEFHYSGGTNQFTFNLPPTHSFILMVAPTNSENAAPTPTVRPGSLPTPTPTSTTPPSTGQIYVCDSPTTEASAGNQIQISAQNCHLAN